MVRTRPEVNRSTQAVQVASVDARDCIHGPPAGVFNESRELRSPHCETRIVSACELRVSHVGVVSQAFFPGAFFSLAWSDDSEGPPAACDAAADRSLAVVQAGADAWDRDVLLD